MNIFIIAILILLGLIFCVVEMLILPGITLGALLSAAFYGGAIYIAFTKLGLVGGVVIILISGVLSLIAIVFSLRAKTWDRFSLKSKIDSSSSAVPQNQVSIGDAGVTISRLSPMGRVEINGSSYEAKSSDVYIDSKREVEVVGFENFSVVVKEKN